MIVLCVCLIPFLFSFTYVKDITLGAPDTVKILVDPVRVVEKNDTIIVLDQEGSFQFLKRYTLDGFFLDARLYSSKTDSQLFSHSWVEPDTVITNHAYNLTLYSPKIYLGNAHWQAMFLEPDSTIWLVCSCWDGDAAWLALIALFEQDSVLKAAGYGPSGGDYDISSIRGGIWKNFYLYVSNRYVYLVSGEFLWQYDKQARFVRKIGIEPNQCFKEPCGITVDNHGYVYISDFRLGIVWEYRPGGKTLNLKPMLVSEYIKPNTPTSLAFSTFAGLWINDINMRLVTNIIYHEVKRTFGINKITCCPGGTNFQIALADSFLFAHYNNQVFKYSLYGEYIETYQRTDYEGKKDNIVSMDNTGNIYMFRRGTDWGDVTFYCIDPIAHDTSALVLPDTFQPNRLNWKKEYRTGDTLYMYGVNSIYPPKGKSSSIRGFFIFINDTLKYTISESEFEGGLPKRIIDFAVDSYGLIWLVDIEKRIVQRYRLLPEYDN